MRTKIIYILLLIIVLAGWSKTEPTTVDLEPVVGPDVEVEVTEEPGTIPVEGAEPTADAEEELDKEAEVVNLEDTLPEGIDVEITKNLKFHPSELNIVKGATVTWQNNARAVLRPVIKTIPYDSSRNVKLDRLEAREIVMHTFNESGQYIITISYGSTTMKSIINVGE